MSHIPCEANQLVNGFAKIGMQLHSYCNTYDNDPPFLSVILFSDRHGLGSREVFRFLSLLLPGV